MENLLEHFLMETKPENFTSLSYEQLSNWEVGKAVIKEAVNHWEYSGFLYGIENQTKKEMLAVAFDNFTHDALLENERIIKIAKKYDFNCAPDNDKYSFNFYYIIYIILRRVVCGVVGQSDGVKNFSYKKFLDYLEDYSFLAINYDGYDKELDLEAEFCSILSSIIEERFDNEKNV